MTRPRHERRGAVARRAWRSPLLGFALALSAILSSAAAADDGAPPEGLDPGIVKLRHADFMLEQGQFQDALRAYEEAAWFFSEGSDGLVRSRRGQAASRAGIARPAGGSGPAIPRAIPTPAAEGPGTPRPAGANTLAAAAGADPPSEEAGAARPVEERGAGAALAVEAPAAVIARPPEPARPAVVARATVSETAPAPSGALAGPRPGGSVPDSGERRGAGAAGTLLAAGVLVLAGWGASRNGTWMARLSGWARRRKFHRLARGALERAGRLRPEDPVLRRERAWLAVQAWDLGAEARRLYASAASRTAAPELVRAVARLYRERGVVDGDARLALEQAAELDPEDATCWEALESLVPETDPAGRLPIARKLIALGRATPARLHLAALNDARASRVSPASRALYHRALESKPESGGDDARRELLAVLVPLYLAQKLEGPDARTVFEAAVETLEPGPPDGDGLPRFGGALRHWAREIARALERQYRAPEDARRAFALYRDILQRFRGEPTLVEGFVRTAMRAGVTGDALAELRGIYPLDGVDGATTAAVARSLVLAVGRGGDGEGGPEPGGNERHEVMVLAATRDHLASLDGDEVRRPDVREILSEAEQAYEGCAVGLAELDAEFADRMWKLGDYPTAVGIFFHAAGLRVDRQSIPLQVHAGSRDADVLEAHRGAVVQIVPDRAPTLSEVISLSGRVEADPSYNPRVAFVVSRARESRDIVAAIFRMVGTGKPPVIPLPWLDLYAALAEGRAERLLQRHVRRWLSRDDHFAEAGPVEDPGAFYGHEALIAELAQALSGPGRPMALLGLRRSGKTSLALQLAREMRGTAVAWIDLSRPEGEGPAEGVWATVLRRLAEDAWRKGLAPASTRARPTPVPDGGTPEALVTAFERFRRDLSEQGPAPHVTLLVDGVDAAVEAPDPLGGETADGWPGLPALLEAVARLTAGGEVSALLLARGEAAVRPDIAPGRGNPLLGRLDVRHLPPLDAAACDAMVSGIGAAMGMSFEPRALRAIHDSSGGHPFIARQIASTLVQRHPHRPVLLGLRDVERAVDVWLHGRRHREEMLAQVAALPDAARGVLRAVARTAPDHCDLPRIQSQLSDRWTPAEVARGVAALTDHHLLVEDDGGYRLTIGILRLWLQRTLQRAAEEEARAASNA